MKKWLRTLLGFSDLEATIESLEKIIHSKDEFNQSLLQHTGEKINKLSAEILEKHGESERKMTDQLALSNKSLSEVSNQLQQLLPKEVTLETLTKFQLGRDNRLAFEKIDLSELEERNLIPVATRNASSGVMSSIVSGALYGQTINYTSEGLFRASANVNDLVRYADGSYGSIVSEGGKFSSHHGFNAAGASAMWPVLALQLATIITSQQHMQEIGKQLKVINGNLKKLADFHKNERIAQLQYINERLEIYQSRKHFTVEDFVLFETFKYDLSKIKRECMKFFDDKMKELVEKYNLSSLPDFQSHFGAEESLKKKFSRKAGNFVKSTKSFFQNTNSNVKEFVRDFRDSDLFAYGEIAVAAEKLYDAFLYQELVSNMSVKNLDADRVGKIDELMEEFADHQNSDKQSTEIFEVLKSFKESMENYRDSKKSSAINWWFQNNKDEVDKKILGFQEEFVLLESLLTSNYDNSPQKQLLRTLGQDFEIIIDNRGDREIIYTNELYN